MPHTRESLLATDAWGYNPLHLACFDGEPDTDILEISKSLFPEDYIEYINTPTGTYINQDGAIVDLQETALTLACGIGGNLTIVQALLTAGADVNQPNAQGVTPLMSACLRDDDNSQTQQPIIELLVTQPTIQLNTYNGTNTALSLAFDENNHDIASYLLAQETINTLADGQYGARSLFLASRTNNLLLVEKIFTHLELFFIRHQITPEKADETRQQVLHELQDYEGIELTALQVACIHGHPDIVIKLLPLDKDLNIQSTAGCTALDYAISRAVRNQVDGQINRQDDRLIHALVFAGAVRNQVTPLAPFDLTKLPTGMAFSGKSPETPERSLSTKQGAQSSLTQCSSSVFSPKQAKSSTPQPQPSASSRVLELPKDTQNENHEASNPPKRQRALSFGSGSQQHRVL